MSSQDYSTRSPLPVVVAITGATGIILGIRLVEALLTLKQPTHLIISDKSFPVIYEEMDLQLPKAPQPQKEAVLATIKLPGPVSEYETLLTCHGNNQLGAAPSSGTFLTRGMAIIPCSMATLGRMASGVTDNLVTRAGDVTLKEKRKLIIVPRESPFNAIHLENLLKLDRCGAVILPPMLSFYQEAFNSIDGQINYTIGKVLDHLGLTQHELFPRWS